MTGLTRRHALFATVAAPLAAASLGLPQKAQAQAELQGAGGGLFRRFRHGGFEITTLLAGTGENANPKGTFGINVSDEDFAASSAAAFIPTERAVNFFTPVLVNTGKEDRKSVV